MFRPFCLVFGLAALTAAAMFTQPRAGAAFLNPDLVPDRQSGLIAVAKDLVGPKIPLRAVPFDLADVRLLDGPFLDAQRREPRVPAEPRHRAAASHVPPQRGAALRRRSPRRMGGPGRRAARPQRRPLPLGLRADLDGDRRSRGSRRGPRPSWRSWRTARRRARGAATIPATSPPSPSRSSTGWTRASRSGRPWYTLHKIMAGLLDVYLLLRRPAGPGRPAGHDPAGSRSRVDPSDHGAEAGDARDRVRRDGRGARQPLRDHRRPASTCASPAPSTTTRCFDPLARGEDRLDGLHANTQIPKIIGAAREYELTGESRYRDVARFFWDRVATTAPT